MGALQTDLPIVPVLVGILALAAGLVFASARGADEGGWVIIAFGLLLAVIWTGFLRVGSQTSLLLAPIAAFLLLLGWLSVPLGYGERKWANERPTETLRRRGIIEDKTKDVLPAPVPGQAPPLP